jgi:hypothetical protein
MLSIHSGMSFLNDYPAPSNMSLESCSQPTTVAAATSFHRSSPTFSIDSHEDWRYIKNEAMTSQEMATSQSSTTSTSTTSSAFIYPHQQPRKYQDNLPVDSFGRLACPNDMIHTIYDPFISRPYSPPTTYHYSKYE